MQSNSEPTSESGRPVKICRQCGAETSRTLLLVCPNCREVLPEISEGLSGQLTDQLDLQSFQGRLIPVDPLELEASETLEGGRYLEYRPTVIPDEPLVANVVKTLVMLAVVIGTILLMQHR